MLQNFYRILTIVLCGYYSTIYTDGSQLFGAGKAFSHLHWDWSTLATSTPPNFPKNFIFGAGTSAYQVEGGVFNNSYTKQEGSPETPESSENSCDHWNLYKDDIQRMKDIGLQAYRFSVEWSKIEPQEGVFNEEALAHYEDVCKELVRQGIQPVITLHHYTDPVWFLEKGGFEDKENIAHFTCFASKVFERLAPYVHLWLTFNSPSGYAMNGYYRGAKPPYVKSMQRMGNVLCNLCEAHVQTYHALKKLPLGEQSKIGILKNIFQLEPHRRYHPYDQITAYVGNMLVNTCMYTFFSTGNFSLWIPQALSVNHTNENAPKSLDFIGLNYYSHGYMYGATLINHSQETATQNPQYTLYPEGIYRALDELSKYVAKPLNIPIYITENGVATNDDDIRRQHAQRYLFAISQAIKDGIDVRGYIHWSLLDNYEWGSYDKQYGIFAINRETQERTLKPGADFLLAAIQAHKTRHNIVN